MYLLRKGAYTDITYHLKAHTISNKLVSKVSAQKKGGGGGGGGSYDSLKCVQISVFSGVVPPSHCIFSPLSSLCKLIISHTAHTVGYIYYKNTLEKISNKSPLQMLSTWLFMSMAGMSPLHQSCNIHHLKLAVLITRTKKCRLDCNHLLPYTYTRLSMQY